MVCRLVPAYGTGPGALGPSCDTEGPFCESGDGQGRDHGCLSHLSGSGRACRGTGCECSSGAWPRRGARPRLACGVPCQVIQLLPPARVAEDHLLSGAQRASRACRPSAQTQNADSHGASSPKFRKRRTWSRTGRYAGGGQRHRAIRAEPADSARHGLSVAGPQLGGKETRAGPAKPATLARVGVSPCVAF
jgi:hypothetical protein